MKILAFTDVHANKNMLKAIVNKANNSDLLICSGDLSFFCKGLNESIKILLKSNKRILIIHGNHEMEEQIEKLENKYRNVIYIHKKPVEINGYIFVGYGGDGFSIYDKNLEKYFNNKKFMNNKLIIVTHAPPRNTKLDYIPGIGHVGNLSINKAIIRLKPLLHICGHIHECFKKNDKLGKTLIVNPGCYGKILNI